MTVRLPRFARAFAVLVLAVVACSPRQEASGVLRFAGIPDQRPSDLEAKFKPLADYFERSLGVRAEYVPLRDYQSVVESFRNGDITLAWFGGLTGVQARVGVPGARAIAQGDVDPHYVTYFIAHRSTKLTWHATFPRAIANLTFTFGSESSTSGRLMPEHFIKLHTGQTARTFFKHTPNFSGSHDKTAELVESGRVQVGAINYLVYEQRVAEGRTDPDVVRVIWKSPPFPDYHWTAHPKLDADFGRGFIDRLQRALIAIDQPQLLAALPRRRLIAAANHQFDGVAQVARDLGMLR